MIDKEQIIIDGVVVSKCERHCSDNYNTPNMCYSDITRGYRYCNPKENQCDFYITSIEEQLACKTQECERMKYYLSKIRQDELSRLDVEWDEYITECTSTDYSNIITYVEYALGERKDD